MSDERLGSTLFLAALVHGVVILGVTFSGAPFMGERTLPSLNVTLVVDTDQPEELSVDTAKLIANRSQRGSGVAAEGRRPTNALSGSDDVAQLGDPFGQDAVDGTPRDATPSAEQLVSRGAGGERVRALPQPTDAAAEVRQRAATSIASIAPQTNVLELSLRAELPEGDNDERTLVATPDTRQSDLAEYLDGWRRRVERIGTANYPTELLGNPDVGRPTLEVVVAADGRLEDIVVLRSSGNKALDQAALKILRLAAPFDPLPENLRDEYDVLRFAYEWDFSAR
jgi:protein TonB